MSKLFTIAGTSVLNGNYNFRFATGSIGRRKSVLKLNGHTEIMLQELPQPMTKEDAAKFLQGLGCTATMPKGSVKKVPEIAPQAPAKTEAELKAEADEAKRVQRNARKRELRAAAKAAKGVQIVAGSVIDTPVAEVTA